MVEGQITDDDAISFARLAIRSVSALELLMLLRRSRHTPRSSFELVREMRSSEIMMARLLEQLMQFGLVEERAEFFYIYKPRTAQLELICERVGSVYMRKPVTLMRAILDAPDEKLRQFVQSFLLAGKDK